MNDFLTRPGRSQWNYWLVCAARPVASDSPTDCARPCRNQWRWPSPDALTGLHNRRYLDTQLAALFDESLRRGKHLSVLVMDIDKFKPINDTYGHDAGDEVLREICQTRALADARALISWRASAAEEIVVVHPPDTALNIAQICRGSVSGSACMMIASPFIRRRDRSR